MMGQAWLAALSSELRTRRERLRLWGLQTLERLDRRPVPHLVMRTAQELIADDATHMAAGVAYYAFMSAFPLLLGLIAILSLFLDSQTVQKQMFDFVEAYVPGSGEVVQQNVETAIQLRGALGVLSLLGLLWSGTAIFGAISRAVNRAWDVSKDRPFYIAKPRHMAMALGVGALFLLSVSTTTMLNLVARLDIPGLEAVDVLNQAAVGLASRLLPLLFTLLIFLLIYKFIPNTPTYWRLIWPGALLSAVLFESGKNAFLLYLTHFANYASVYGSIGSAIALLVWAYISAFILILGAEVSSEYGRMRNGVDRGVLLHQDEEEDTAK